MRLYQWDDETYAKTKSEPTVQLEEDIPGGVRLLCPCGQYFDDISSNKPREGWLQACPHCGRDILFPRADW